MTAVGGAGAATPTKTPKAVASAKVLEAAAVSSVESAMRAASHIRSKAARLEAEKAALQRFETSIKAASASVKPSAAALAEERSPQVRRAEKAVRRPGSLMVRTHGSRRAKANATSNFDWSGNWSGYEDVNATYNYVFGQWTVPSANCGPWYDFNFSQSSTWVGLDGSASSTVEQLGTATGCIAGASAYYAWTEMYPQIENPIFEPLSSGDRMMAFVFSYNNATEDELYMVDITQGWSELRFASTSPVADSSAEWITERPSCGPFCDNLTNFGTTTFTDSYAMTTNGTFGSISSFPNNYVDMWNNNAWCAEVGYLSNGGTQFTDWWEHS